MFDKSKLENLIKSLLIEHNTPSVQIAVIKDGEILLNDAYGYSDVENKIIADKETIYNIGSATKSFTATAIAKLVEEKKLEWDKPVKSYLSDFEMYDSYVTEELTVRDLLCHRCGLPRHDIIWFNNECSSEELVNKLRHLKPSASFRSSFQYNNLMFALAGHLIEKVTNKRWHDYIDEIIIKPLGMKRTYGYIDDALSTDFLAKPYKINEKGIVAGKRYSMSKNNTMGAAGSFCSSAEEILKWVSFNINKGKKITNEEINHEEINQIISEKQISECHSPQIVNKAIFQFAPEEITMQSYGLGWFVEIFKGEKVIYHSGNISGFSAMVAFSPDKNCGFVYLMNTSFTSIQNTLIWYIFDMLFDKEETDWNRKAKDFENFVRSFMKEKSEKSEQEYLKGTKPSLALEEYAGKYMNSGYGEVEIKFVNDNLVLCMKNEEMILTHKCIDTFIGIFNRPVISTPFLVQFKLNPKGKVLEAAIGFEDMIPEGIPFSKVFNY